MIVLVSQTKLLDSSNPLSDKVGAVHIIKESLSNTDLIENENERIYYLINNFQKIYSNIEKSFKLYTNNYNYENIIEQFENKYKSYIDSINISVKALQGQVLGIPVLVVASTFNKVSDNPYSFIALFIYLIFVSLNLNIQYKNLKHIQILTDKIKINQLPDLLRAGTKSEEDSLMLQLQLLKRYFIAIGLLIILVTLYIFFSLYKLL